MIALLGWSLVHFVWQGAAAALLLAVLNRLLRGAAPALRYLAASATLALMLALPFATFAALRSAASSATVPAPTLASAASSVETSAEPVSGESDAWARGWDRARRGIEPLLPAGVAVWTAGVVLLSPRSVGGWVLVRRLRRSGLEAADAALLAALARLRHALGVSAPVRLWRSALVHVPTVVGVLRPVVL